ncbi:MULTISPECIES: protein kinase domain-containing protein [unclassified Streptomyces]|uniref:serine/threonine-protein kinase n=1 Tax=unclassified Streptomyces TaxID=2593676 RepID=UPI002E81C83B|nr:protein kinase [Streptomyces sp. NBC_00589]WTI34945.1 protein kinase [Streptomyces sp. NBC_00775]WUB31381.1 protein kinase [Streptomyces sp. NBC_00589]
MTGGADGAAEWAVPGYLAVRTLGEGAGGRVVLARHAATGVPVAVKYLSDRLRDDQEFLARFRAEARLLGDLRHPCVVRLYEYVEARRGAAIVMEAVNGVSLRELLRARGATGPEAALVLLKGSLLGLGAAHSAGVVHRDYKPENVLVRADGSSALADFGIAVRAGRETEAAGTPAYMAPEQWRGEPAAPAGDVYAAAAVFFECLTGRRPFAGDDVTALRLQHLRAPVALDDVPDPVRGLLRRGMAKDPADRPGIEAFLADLERAATEGYGVGWEERGRRRLAELAALAALLFPFAITPAVYEASRALTVLGRLKRGGWKAAAGAAALAVVAGAVTSATAGPHDTTTTAASSTPTGSSGTTPSSLSSPSVAPSASPGTTPSAAGGSPSATPSVGPSPGETSDTPSTSVTPPVVSTSPTTGTSAVPTPGTVTVTIGSWSRGQNPGTLIAAVTVETTGTGPLTLTADFYVNTPADPYGSQTRTLSGSTQYAVSFEADFSNHPCRGTWIVALTSSPQAADGTQTASVDAPPC